MKDKKCSYKIGLDEVGRGPIAGPVTVGCVALPKKYTWSYFKQLEEKCAVPPLRDSKKLTEKQRNAWYVWVKTNNEIAWAVASNSAQVIDKKGIVFAANSAADKAYMHILRNLGSTSDESRSHRVSVRLDYGLRAPAAGRQTMHKKGDERFVEIALASIMAKVTRDRYMQNVDKRFPLYSFAANKGYGSKAHYMAIHKHGLCKEHRTSFLHL